MYVLCSRTLAHTPLAYKLGRVCSKVVSPPWSVEVTALDSPLLSLNEGTVCRISALDLKLF